MNSLEYEDLLVWAGDADHLAVLRAVEGDLLPAQVRAVHNHFLLQEYCFTSNFLFFLIPFNF
jgi:hypothetical protein